MKNSKEKIPDRLVDFCKHLSINRIAAGSRLPSQVMHGNFSPFNQLFKHTLVNYNIFVLEQGVGPGVLQTFSTCAVKQ